MITELDVWDELDDEFAQKISGGGPAQIDGSIDTGYGAINVIDLVGIEGKLYAVSEDTNIWVLNTYDITPGWQLIGTGVAAIGTVNGDLYGAMLDDRLLKLEL